MEASPAYASESRTKQKMAPWLIVLLIVLAACIIVCLTALCVIIVLALFGPAIGNVFSNIIIGI